VSRSFAGRIAGARKLMVGSVVLVVAEAVRRTRTAKHNLRPDDEFTSTAMCSGQLEKIFRGEADSQDDWAHLLEREVGELTVLADQLYGIAGFARHEEEVGEDTFVRLDDLRWILGSYVLKGGRIRRLMQLPNLLESIAVEANADTSVVGVGSTATELLRRIRDTNSVTVDWLLAHRVALPDPDFLDSNALMDRFNRLQIEPTTVSGDPLYLLTCHIHDMLETTECLGAVDHSLLDRLEVQLAKPITALEDEIKAAMAFDSALLSAAHKVVRTAEAV
jgi:hypothetical protein